MAKVSLDEEFLRWWERSLEEHGYDLDKKQVKVLAHPAKSLYHVYSYHEFFNAMRRGEYAPLIAYQFAYHICNKSRLEELADREADHQAKVIPFPRKKS